MINLLILAYNNLGHDIADAATHILGMELQQLRIIPVSYDDTPGKLEDQLQQVIDDLNTEPGLIILTDIFGATHTNTASKFLVPGKIDLISGLNLPMLLRIINYRHLAFEELVDKAVSGGREGIITQKDSTRSGTRTAE